MEKESLPKVQEVDLELVKIFYLSFRFSQGNPEQQDRIFKLMNRRMLPSELPIDVPEKVMETLPIPKNHIPIYSVRFEVFRSEWRRMYYILCGSQTEDHTKIKSDFIESMIDSERQFLTREDGRLGRVMNGDVEPDSSKDPYASLFRKYILFGKNTGNYFYDKLFQELKDEFEKSPNIIYLEDLENLWELRHPGNKFYPKNNL